MTKVHHRLSNKIVPTIVLFSPTWDVVRLLKQDCGHLLKWLWELVGNSCSTNVLWGWRLRSNRACKDKKIKESHGLHGEGRELREGEACCKNEKKNLKLYTGPLASSIRF